MTLVNPVSVLTAISIDDLLLAPYIPILIIIPSWASLFLITPPLTPVKPEVSCFHTS